MKIAAAAFAASFYTTKLLVKLAKNMNKMAALDLDAAEKLNPPKVSFSPSPSPLPPLPSSQFVVPLPLSLPSSPLNSYSSLPFPLSIPSLLSPIYYLYS